MQEKRAYLTPGPESVGRLLATILHGLDKGESKERKVGFSVDQGVSDTADSLPQLVDVVLDPIHRVCVSDTGYEIFGTPNDTRGVLGKLSVDTTVEPPVALYSENPIS